MLKTIKSYVVRAGRMSSRQWDGLDKLSEFLPTQSFMSEKPLVIEIGFGMGASLLQMAKENPDLNFIGCEVHKPGIGRLISDLIEHDIKNVRIIEGDAVQFIQEKIADNMLHGIQIFFPDPWPKKRHHKRRLIQNAFIAMLANKLKPQGFIHCATDWEDYAFQMLEVLSTNSNLINLSDSGTFVPRPDTRPMTKFEKRGQNLGHGVWDLKFIRNN